MKVAADFTRLLRQSVRGSGGGPVVQRHHLELNTRHKGIAGVVLLAQ